MTGANTINNLELNINEELAPAIETPVLAGGNAIDLAPGAEHTFTIKFKDGGELTQAIVDQLKLNADSDGNPMIGVKAANLNPEKSKVPTADIKASADSWR